jgi:hypothetical protein
MPLFLLVLAGCAEGEGKVSGRVLFNGTPLPGGIVTFVPTGARNHAVCTLDDQGNFEVSVGAGEVQVSVDNRQLQPREPPIKGMPPGIPGGVAARVAEAKKDNPSATRASGGTGGGGPQKMPGKYVEIPKKYYDISTSNLKFTVQRGNQTHDIELTK